MTGWLPVVVALVFAGPLLASGAWASRRYARFEELPAHYDINGRATRMAPRRVMVWMLPILFSVVLVAIAGMTGVIPRDQQNGDPTVGIVVAGIALWASQALVLWLTERWAARR